MFGIPEAREAANEARVKAGLSAVIHLSHGETTALAIYAEKTAKAHGDPAAHVRAAHAAWIATADEWERRRGLKFWDWLKTPDDGLRKQREAAQKAEAQRKAPARPEPPVATFHLDCFDDEPSRPAEGTR